MALFVQYVSRSCILRGKKLTNYGSGIIIRSSCAIDSYEQFLSYDPAVCLDSSFCKHAVRTRKQTALIKLVKH